jgi:hypothetical protein
LVVTTAIKKFCLGIITFIKILNINNFKGLIIPFGEETDVAVGTRKGKKKSPCLDEGTTKTFAGQGLF